MADDELVEWIDEAGRTLGIVTRARLRAENLRHRSVAVIVRSASASARRPHPAVLAHRRADWKDVWPGAWDLAFGGVVAAGESYRAAAQRELAEEAGLTAAMGRRLGSFVYADAFVAAHCEVFEVISDGPFHPADGEVVELCWVSTAELLSWVAAHTMCPDNVAGVIPLLTAPS